VRHRLGTAADGGGIGAPGATAVRRAPRPTTSTSARRLGAQTGPKNSPL
jgi:hypothetical protein